LLWHQPTTPIAFPSDFHRGCGYICFTVKLLGVTFDKHLNFDKHISNVCSSSSYFHIRALRHIRPFLDSETSKIIDCTIVCSRLDYVNSILTGISSCNIHRLQRVQNSLARVVTCSTTNTTSALNSLHWHPIQQRINFKLATLVPFTPQRWPSMLLIFTTSFTPTHQLHSASSISSPDLISTLLLPLVVFDMLALLFGIPSLIISDLPTLTLSSNPI